MFPFPTTDSYLFWWLLLPFLFYPFYFAAFFLKQFKPLVIYCVTVTAVAFFVYGYNNEAFLALYAASAVIFGAGIRAIQLFRQKLGERGLLSRILVYGLLPCVGALFWPGYLIIPPIVEKWQARPTDECIAQGRLISLGPDAIYRLYPKYGTQLWAYAQNGEIFNVSSKAFCQFFSADTASPVQALHFNVSELCRSPQTLQQQTYCAAREKGIALSEIALTHSELNKNSSWQMLQERLKRKPRQDDIHGRYIGGWVQTTQPVSGVTLHEFFRHSVEIVIDRPDWLPVQQEPLLLSCSQRHIVRCQTSWLYQDGWRINYSYSRFQNNDNPDYDEFDEETVYVYGEDYVAMQLEAARQAAESVTAIIEEMRVKH